MKTPALLTTAALAAALLALTACTAGVTDTAEPDWKPKPVKWSECAPDDPAVSEPGLVCATLKVPVDYSDPEGGTTEIALSKLAATGKAEKPETVLLNPGGPGAGGRSLPYLGTELLADLATGHDLVGFDPRGTGASAPLDCLDQAATLTGFEPTEEAMTAAIEAQTKDRTACIAENEEYIGSMNAETTARDMDAIRVALGLKKVDYLGYSWGTYLGAVYRSLFPDSIDEVALDSIAPPDIDLGAIQPGVAELGAPALQAFAEYAAASPEGASLGTSADEVKTTLTELSNTMLGKQVTVADDVTVGAAGLSDLVFASRALWPEALPRIVQMQSALGTLADVEPGTDIVASGIEAAYLCNDSTAEQSAASAWKNIAKLRTEHPDTWTATQAYYYGFCVDWPADLSPDPVTLEDTGRPLLLAAHTDELVTPEALAPDMQSVIGGSLLTMEDDVHGSTGSASPCGAAAVTEFLRNGTTETTTCEYDIPAL